MNRRGIRRLFAIAVCTGGLAAVCSGYYHFVHFTGAGAPYLPIWERFDLNALPDQTVQFFLNDPTVAKLAEGDSIPALVSEIRAAAAVWNGVETSEIRLAYGGMTTGDTPQSTPGIDIVFSDDIPPGLVALGGPTTRGEMVSDGDHSFVPIQRSVLLLRKDLTNRPSWSERFFMSVVHEFGHTLGLQHTLTSATMSTEITRATTKAAPLAADDVIGLSLLYPSRNFLAQTGTITGSVTMGGSGVNLASVVAINPTGPAISTITNPDGTYRLAGLPSGDYYLYVHPLPPALFGETTPANIIAPAGPSDRVLAAPDFETQFYGGSAAPTSVSVVAGAALTNVNFEVAGRGDSSPVYAVQTYSFFGSNAVKPGFFAKSATRPALIAAGANLVSNSAPAAGLRVRTLDNVDGVTEVSPYASGPENWVQADLSLNASAPDGVRHLLFTLDDDLYVLPAAYRVTSSSPPFISELAPAGEGTIRVTGANIGSGTTVLFDGVKATIKRASEGELVVTPPPAPGGHRAAVVAMNPDGQSSLFLQRDSVPSFTYDSSEESQALTLAPTALPAGVETFIEINGTGTSFVHGVTRVAFGSSDIAVRRVWVFTPTRLLVEVSVARNASPATTPVTVTTGLRLYSQPYSFTLQPDNPRQLSLGIPSPTGADSFTSGGFATVAVRNLPADGPVLKMYVGSRRAAITSVDGGSVSFQIPNDLGSGLAVVALQAGSDFALPTLLFIAPRTPVIGSVFVDNNVVVSPFRPARKGDLLSIMVFNLAQAGIAVDRSRVRVFVGDTEFPVTSIIPNKQFSAHLVLFTLGARSSSGDQFVPLRVVLDGRSSAPFYVTVAP